MDEAARQVGERQLAVAPDRLVDVSQCAVEVTELTPRLGADGAG